MIVYVTYEGQKTLPLVSLCTVNSYDTAKKINKRNVCFLVIFSNPCSKKENQFVIFMKKQQKIEQMFVKLPQKNYFFVGVFID